MSGASCVVVTGGAGFIGSHLVDTLLADGNDEIVVFDNLERGRLANLAGHDGNARLRFVRGDIRDELAVRQAMRGARLVYHLAAQASVMGAARDRAGTFGTNVAGTFNVLRAAADERVERVVFASSREVYGEPVSLPVEESHPLLSINLYGASKVAGEALCRSFAHEYGIRIAILRLANVYGARDFGRVIPLWINSASRGENLVVYGGTQILDFVWVGEAVRALIEAGARKSALPPINVGSGTGTKIMDLARRIVAASGVHPEITVVPARSIEVVRFVASTSRMTHLLSLVPSADPLAHLGALIRSPAGVAA